MTFPFDLLSTDFDGTLFAEFENPPIPPTLCRIIEVFQAGGGVWVINTGRDLSSLLETLGRTHVPIKPDYLVTVEREIHVHEGGRYVGHAEWNKSCERAHHRLFRELRSHLTEIIGWVEERYVATVYEDAWSPFCLIANTNEDCDQIQAYLDQYCHRVPGLCAVRNDVYIRLSHKDYNKGSALRKIGSLVSTGAERTLAAGDHLNDLPMLRRDCAHFLVAPANAVKAVREQVTAEGGYVSSQLCGDGVARGIEHWIEAPSGGNAAAGSKE